MPSMAEHLEGAHKLLEETNIEDIMDLSVWRKSQVHNDVFDELGDVVAPEEVRLELPLW